MFIRKEKLMKAIEKGIEKALSGKDKIPSLKEEIQGLKDEIADLQTTKKQEQRDIEHLVKIKEEKLGIEHQKSELKLKDEYKTKEMKLQTEYFDKVMKQVNEAKTDMQSIYAEILKRLPNVSAALEVKRRS